MAILARYTPKHIDVEVLDVYKTRSGKRALIRAINCEPFTVHTHGGPMTTDSALVSVDLLGEVRQEPAPRPARKSYLLGDRPEQPSMPAEYAGFFPARNRAAVASTSRGGINND